MSRSIILKKSVVLLAAVCLVISMSSCDRLVESQVKKQILKLQESQEQLLTSDNLHVVTLGTGGPISNKTRVSSGIAVIADGKFFLVDVGPGIVRNLNLESLPGGSITAVLLTHFHSDHISELGELNFMSWALGRPYPLDVYGPEGVDEIVAGFNQAYALDSSYRTAHHGEKWMPSKNSTMLPNTIGIAAGQDSSVIYEENGLKIIAFQTDHSPVKPSLGYRFEYKGNVVVISGDTVATETLAKYAENADLFFCEALNKELISTFSEIAEEAGNPRLSAQMHDVLDYHISPVEAAKLAQQAKAKKLVLVHIVPPVENMIVKSLFLDGTSEAFSGEIILAEDGEHFELTPK